MAETEINIGCIIDLSNEAKQDSLGIKQGVNLAVQDFRSDGHRVNVHFVDDKSDVFLSARAFDELKRNQKIRALIGPTWSYQLSSLAPIIEQEKMITFVPAIASDTVIFRSRYVLYGAEKNIYKKEALGKFFSEKSVRRVAALVSQDAWGVSHLPPMFEACKTSGASLVYTDQLLPYISSFGEGYIKDSLLKMRSQKPDVIIWAGYEAEAATLSRLLLEMEFSCPIIADQLLFDTGREEFVREYKGELFQFTTPTAEDYAAHVREALGADVLLYSDSAYDGTRMLLGELAKRGEQAKGEELMKNFKGDDFRYEGYSGTFRFDSVGDMVSGGRWVIQKVK